MMPYLIETRSRREIVDTFGGVNKSKLIREGEWSETQNISLDNYPVFSVRKKEGLYLETNMDAAVAKGDKLFYITAANQTTAGKLYKYDGEGTPVEIQGITLTAVNGHKLVSFGAYVIIMPEKIWFNTAIPLTETVPGSSPAVTYETYDHGAIEAEGWMRSSDMAVDYKDSSGNTISLASDRDSALDKEIVYEDGLTYQCTVISDDPPKKIWEKIEVNTFIYENDSYESSFLGLDVGDGVSVYGVSVVSDQQVESYYGEHIIISHNESEITLSGFIKANDENEFKFKRHMPLMDFVFESNNRLWGCRYGENNDGENVNEIYASALGDFKNWSKYAGVSTDSYAASIGTDGPFTGAYNYLGYPTFFKENYIHKVYGAYPAQYQIQTTSCPDMGVMAGCDRSLAVCNHVLYFKARNCICAYDGNYPVSVSSALGDEQFKLIDAVGGSCRGRYYISMSNAYHNNITYVYYASLKKWVKAFEHPIREPRIEFFVPFRDDLLYGGPNRNCYCVYNTKNTVSETISWSATSGLWQITSPDKKYVSKLVIRMKLPAESTFKAEIEYDSSGTWETKANLSAVSTRLASFNLPILPRRCDHLRLRLSGTGDCEIYSITKTIENGSDI